MAFLPLDKNFQPGFSDGRSKPTVNFELNFRNPLTRGLQICFDGDMDYLDSQLIQRVNPASTSSGFDTRGKFHQSNSTTDGGIYLQNGRMAAFSGQPFLSILTVCALDSSDNFGNLVGIPWEESDPWNDPFYQIALVRSDNDDFLRLHFTSGGSALNAESSAGFLQYDGTNHVYGAVKDDSTTARFYKDGAQHSTSVDANNSSNIDAGNSSTILSFSRNMDGTAEGTDGKIHLNLAWNRKLSDREFRAISDEPWRIFKPTTQTGYFTASAAGVTSAITGTATATITETDITDGGKTIIVTLTGDTFKASGTGPIGSTADTQALIDGFDAAASPTNGWNNEVRDKALTSEVVRTSSTIATWTISAQAGYDISSTETITGTIPTDVLVTGAGALTSTPTFTIDAVVSGRIMGSLAGAGGLAGVGGLAGRRGGMAG